MRVRPRHTRRQHHAALRTQLSDLLRTLIHDSIVHMAGGQQRRLLLVLADLRAHNNTPRVIIGQHSSLHQAPTDLHAQPLQTNCSAYGTVWQI
jgi:hypothetical protein